MLFVIIRSKAGAANTRNFPGTRVRIGRQEPADLVLDDPAVSPIHAELVVEGDMVEIRDLSSTNGTKLNSVPITRAAVRPEDTITIGTHALQVELIEDTAQREPFEGESLEERFAWLTQEFAMLAAEHRSMREELRDVKAALAKLARGEKP